MLPTLRRRAVRVPLRLDAGAYPPPVPTIATRAAGVQPRLAVDHDPLARGQPFLHDGEVADLHARGDGARLRRLLLIDDEDVAALLSGLHRFGRHREHAALHVELHGEKHELTRPEPAPGVREVRLARHRSRQRVDGVVEKGELARRRWPACCRSPPPSRAADAAATARCSAAKSWSSTGKRTSTGLI